MMASIRAEWIKLVTTRTFYGLTATAGGFAALVVFGVMAGDPTPWHVTQPLHESEGWKIVGITVSLFSLMLGAKLFTDESRYGSIVHTFFANPGRTRALAGKAVAAAGGAAITATTALIGAAVGTYAPAALSGGDITIRIASDVVPALGLVAVGITWAIMGLGLGAIVKNQVPAAVSAILWVLVMENIAGSFMGDAVRFLPGRLADGVAQAPTDGAVLGAGVGALLLALYAATMWMLGWSLVRRRDIP
jgi:ABC-type transport system involved in multi-copper enzyme maturation permease subunit